MLSNNHLATIEYSLQERKIFLTKILIPKEINEVDFEKKFIQLVFEDIKKRNLSVIPTCAPLISFLRKNKQYKELLPIGVKI